MLITFALAAARAQAVIMGCWGLLLYVTVPELQVPDPGSNPVHCSHVFEPCAPQSESTSNIPSIHATDAPMCLRLLSILRNLPAGVSQVGVAGHATGHTDTAIAGTAEHVRPIRDNNKQAHKASCAYKQAQLWIKPKVCDRVLSATVIRYFCTPLWPD